MNSNGNRKLSLTNTLAVVTVILLGCITILGSCASDSSSGEFLTTDFADAGPDQNAPALFIVRLDGRGTFIPNKSNSEAYLTYFWEFQQVPQGSEAVLMNADRVTPTFVPDAEGVYLIKLTARSIGYGQDTDQVAINAYMYDGPPTADAGPDLDVKKGQLVTLDGSRSYDTDYDAVKNSIKTFTWYMVQAPSGAGPLDTTTGCSPTFIPTEYGRYLIRLWVEDDEGIISEPDEVIIGVNSNHFAGMPAAIAGPDQNVITGSVVQLDGRGSSDPDDRPLDYFWRIVSRPPASLAELSDATSVTPTFTADRDGVYVVRLFVGNGTHPADFKQPVNRWIRDDQGYDYHDQDRLVVTASFENQLPVADAGMDRVVPLSSLVTLDGSGSYDPEGDDLVYDWVMLFKPTAGSVPMTGYSTPAPSFTVNVPGIYGVRLRVADESNPVPPLERVSPPDMVLVHATDNQSPIADAGADIDHVGGSPVILDGRGSYDPDGDPLGFSWGYVSGPVLYFPAFSDPLSSTPSFTPGEDGHYVVRLLVHDGELSSVADTVAVTVTGITQLPALGVSPSTLDFGNSLTDLDFKVENAGDGTLSWSITANLPVWLAAVPMSGSNGPAEWTSIDVTVDRMELAAATYTHDISLTSNGGGGTVNISMTVTGSSGAEALTVASSLPWAPSAPEIQTVFYLDYPSVGQISLGQTVPVSQAALLATFNSVSDANFSVMTMNGWELDSRTHTDPVSESAAPSFVVKRLSDNVYFKITVDFTAEDNNAYVQVDGLEAWKCGSSPGDCP